MALRSGAVPKEKMMENDDNNLPNMKQYEFWKLVRKHRPWLRTDEAAAYLGVTPRRLVDWRAKGKGPTCWKKHKCLRYHVDTLDAFMGKPV